MAKRKSYKDLTDEEPLGNPVWFNPIMFGLMLTGGIWIIVFYISSGQLPLPIAGPWNIVIAFGIILAGFLMMVKWK